ncbi:hypothetical protein [Bacillus suaedaesalsae]|uniref:Uncharacterized protein n=1 Tax=Bacillus suaedaesalsae TaxID=2810349 RepID=A0ABS2DFY5_9BACI|nr:hypothetical protein [Bacillus suaedaesalsae]MBM6617389.1 hypothetical protein [Bacillus suaedaesalsae]
MIEVTSYFLKPNVLIDDIEKASIHRNQYFIEVNDREKVLKHISTTHPVYPGMIEIKHGQTTILGTAYNDSVDGLWYNIIQCLNLLTNHRHVSAPFVYHPFELALTFVQNNHEEITISIIQEDTIIDSWRLPRYETITALLHGANLFFKQLKELNFNLVVNDSEDILDTITKLKTQYDA